MLYEFCYIEVYSDDQSILNLNTNQGVNQTISNSSDECNCTNLQRKCAYLCCSHHLKTMNVRMNFFGIVFLLYRLPYYPHLLWGLLLVAFQELFTRKKRKARNQLMSPMKKYPPIYSSNLTRKIERLTI